RMTVSALLERRASALYRLGRIDEMEEALLSAEREALAAGAGASARELRLGRAWRLDEAGRVKAASQLLRQVLAEPPPLRGGWRTLPPELLLYPAQVEDNPPPALVVRDRLPR